MSKAWLMSFKPDYTICIIQRWRLAKMQKKFDTKKVTMCDKKTWQLHIDIERFCVCRFIQTVYSWFVGEGREAGAT